MSRLAPLRVKVDESETSLMGFREREDAVLLADQDKNVITEQVNTLTTAYAEAKSERIRLETKLNALRNLRASHLRDRLPRGPQGRDGQRPDRNSETTSRCN